MLKGKVALVTGGSRGMGAVFTKKLASLGADVAVIYAGNSQLAEEVCDFCKNEYGVKAESYCCNVADYDQAKEVVGKIKEDFGTVDILINNAGITRDKLIAMMREKDFDDDHVYSGTFHAQTPVCSPHSVIVPSSASRALTSVTLPSFSSGFSSIAA